MGKKEKRLVPSRYRHLTRNTRIEVYVAEFLSRNKKFMKAYNHIQLCGYFKRKHGIKTDLTGTYYDLLKEFAGRPSLSLSGKKLSSGEAFYVTLLDPILVRRYTDDTAVVEKIEAKREATLAKVDKKLNVQIKKARNRKEQGEALEEYYRDSASTVRKFGQIFPSAATQKRVLSFYGPDRVGKSYDLKNTLHLKIDLDRLTKDDLRQIEEILTIHKTGKRHARYRAAVKNWNYYLMVYDLRINHKMTFDEIADEMNRCYPTIRAKYDDTMAQNYLKRARNLINKGYLRYI